MGTGAATAAVGLLQASILVQRRIRLPHNLLDTRRPVRFYWIPGQESGLWLVPSAVFKTVDPM